jgi:hypothetical protein
MVAATVVRHVAARRRGIRTKFVFGTSLLADKVAPTIYDEFLPSALADSRYQAAPPPLVFGAGLDRLQVACDAS